ncbi:hypothetical protein M0R45_024575 [Rubus argutus]|uniref:Uncharacterized protein n=1 Tax=Rubus argutus TaxID=59490 RepID=A0AAW1WS56_RUBAR
MKNRSKMKEEMKENRKKKNCDGKKKENRKKKKKPDHSAGFPARASLRARAHLRKPKSSPPLSPPSPRHHEAASIKAQSVIVSSRAQTINAAVSFTRPRDLRLCRYTHGCRAITITQIQQPTIIASSQLRIQAVGFLFPCRHKAPHPLP